MHWLRERGLAIDDYCQFVVVRTPAGLRRDVLAGALQAMVDRHAALRMRLTDDWRLAVMDTVDAADCLTVVPAPGATDDELRRHVRNRLPRALAQLSPRSGAMLRAVWLDAGPDRRGQLLLVIHHLAVDGVSWRILLPDLAAAAAGRQLDLVPTSFHRWTCLVAEDAGRRAAELSWWAGTFAGNSAIGRPLDPARDIVGRARSVTLTLPTSITAALLTAVPPVFHCEINHVLLTALALAVDDVTAGTGLPLVVDLEGHGREDPVDLSRTVGWFTSMFPVRLTLGRISRGEARAGGPAVGRALRDVKEQLRRVPDRGVGYGRLRYLDPAAAAVLRDHGRPAVGFNYLGRFRTGEDGDWSHVDEDGVLAHVAPDMPMAHAIEIVAVTRDQPDGPRLSAAWRWAPDAVGSDLARGLADSWFAMLTAVVRHASRPDAGGRTPSDFFLSDLSQAEIDEIDVS
jgi:non-ribosomal peptide synthase protein (TIGR01720 family)